MAGGHGARDRGLRRLALRPALQRAGGEGTHYCVINPNGGYSLSPGRAAPAPGALFCLLGLGLMLALGRAWRLSRRAHPQRDGASR